MKTPNILSIHFYKFCIVHKVQFYLSCVIPREDGRVTEHKHAVIYIQSSIKTRYCRVDGVIFLVKESELTYSDFLNNPYIFVPCDKLAINSLLLTK